MKNFVRTTLLAATLAGVSFGAFATAVPNPPLPAQDPIVQHLKLTNDQIIFGSKNFTNNWKPTSVRFL